MVQNNQKDKYTNAKGEIFFFSGWPDSYTKINKFGSITLGGCEF
jgi:hypothetical protein